MRAHYSEELVSRIHRVTDVENKFVVTSWERDGAINWETGINIYTVCVLVTHSCPTLCDPVDCSLPGSSVHRTLQARALEWGAIHFSRASSRPRG